MPYLLAFQIQNYFFDNLERLIDLVFILDVIISFNVSFQRSDGNWEESHKEIAKNYLKSTFIIDFITSIPFNWILSSQMSQQNYNKIFRIMKLPKLIGTLKMTKIFHLSQLLRTMNLDNFWRFKIKVKENFIKIIYITLFTYLVLHVASCFYIIIGKLNIYQENWLKYIKIENQDNFEIYINSLYYCFVVLTTVGYGDIVSRNTLERIFTLFWMLFGIAFYSFTIGFITQFFTLKENRKTLLEKKKKMILKFAEEKKLNKEMTDQLIESFSYASTKICYRWLDNQIDLMKNMNQQLKYDFYKEVHSELFSCLFFKILDPSFAVKIISILQPIQIKKNQFIWKKDDFPQYICFICSGIVFLMDDNPFLNKKKKPKQIKRRTIFEKIQQKKILPKKKNEWSKNVKDLIEEKYFAFQIYEAGSYLGEEEIFFQERRKYYLKAASDVDLMVLYKKDFEILFEYEFPQVYNKIFKISQEKRKVMENQRLNLFKDIQQACIKRKIIIPNIDLQDQLQFNNKKVQEEVNYQSLDDYYQEDINFNPVEEILKDIKIQEYEKENSEIQDDFHQVYSPGLGKMFHDWRGQIKRNLKQIYQK